MLDVQAEKQSELLDVEAVAALLTCSARHVRRLADAGKLPKPVKLGSLVRWKRDELRDWVHQGCKPVRSLKASAV